MTAGAAVQWLRDGLGIIGAASETSALAEQVTDSGGVWAVPAFQGLGTPHADPDARAAIGGLSRATTKAHIVRAVLEGIAFRCSEVVAALIESLEVEMPRLVRVDGGAAANDFLLRQLANVLGVPVERPATLQATALGAAYLAGLATGFWSSTGAVRGAWKRGACFEPAWTEEERQRRLGEWLAKIKTIRPAGG